MVAPRGARAARRRAAGGRGGRLVVLLLSSGGCQRGRCRAVTMRRAVRWRSLDGVGQRDELADGHGGLVHGPALGLDDQASHGLEAGARVAQLEARAAAALGVQVVAVLDLEQEDAVARMHDDQVDLELAHLLVVQVLLVLADGVHAVHLERLQEALEVQHVAVVEVGHEYHRLARFVREASERLVDALLVAEHERIRPVVLLLPRGVLRHRLRALPRGRVELAVVLAQLAHARLVELAHDGHVELVQRVRLRLLGRAQRWHVVMVMIAVVTVMQIVVIDGGRRRLALQWHVVDDWQRQRVASRWWRHLYACRHFFCVCVCVCLFSSAKGKKQARGNARMLVLVSH